MVGLEGDFGRPLSIVLLKRNCQPRMRIMGDLMRGLSDARERTGSRIGARLRQTLRRLRNYGRVRHWVGLRVALGGNLAFGASQREPQ